MALVIPREVYSWLISLKILQNVDMDSAPLQQVLYNDTIYLENGYLIGKLLRVILKQHQQSSTSLLKLRKIAFLSSNENWHIVKPLLTLLGYADQVDPQQLTFSSISTILYYLYSQFANIRPPKQPKLHQQFHLDLSTFTITKPLTQCQNLLQYTISLLHISFGLQISQCLGLLVDKCKMIKKIIHVGTNYDAYESVVKLYECLLENYDDFTALLERQPNNFNFFMEVVSEGVCSANQQVCKLCCVVYQSISDQTWLNQVGYLKLMQSEYLCSFQLLLKKIDGQLDTFFNYELEKKIGNRNDTFKLITCFLMHLPRSIYCKEVIEGVDLTYYLLKALEVFDPDTQSKQPLSARILSRELLGTMDQVLWPRINFTHRGQLLLVFQPHLCHNYQQRIRTLISLFILLQTQIIKQLDSVQKHFRVILHHYTCCGNQLRHFIIDNLHELYCKLKFSFPVGLLIESYQVVQIAQAVDYKLLEAISKDDQLVEEEAMTTLKIASTYYNTQMHTNCFLEIMQNLATKNRVASKWAKNVYEKILDGWDNMDIPQLSKTQQSSSKAKSKIKAIGPTRHQIMRHFSFGKVKKMLLLMHHLRDRQFLKQFDQKVTATIHMLEKKNERTTRGAFLVRLVNLIRNHLESLRDSPSIAASRKKQTSSSDSIQIDNNKIEQEKQEDQNDQFETPTHQDKAHELLSKEDKTQNNKSSLYVADQQSVQKQIPLQTKPQTSRLLPFTQQPLQKPRPQFLCSSSLQTYQIIYIASMKDKHRKTLSDCYSLYRSLNNAKQFFTKLKLSQYCDQDLISLQRQCKQVHPDKDQQYDSFVQFMVQTALAIFDYRQTRRNDIKCIQSFFNLLSDRLKQLPQIQSTVLPMQTKSKEFIRKIQFHHNLSNTISIDQIGLNSYAVCFDVLNSIVQKACGVPLMEPLSQVVNEFIVKHPEVKPTDSQLQELLEIVEKQPIESPRKTKSPSPDRRTPKLNKVTLESANAKHEQSKQQGQSVQKLSQLKQKITKRRIQLQQSSMKNINDLYKK